jgi:transposase
MEPNQTAILNGVYNHISLEQIAKVIGKSKSTVAFFCKKLEEEGYIDNPYEPGGKRLAVARKLTEKGLKVLRDEHLIR